MLSVFSDMRGFLFVSGKSIVMRPKKQLSISKPLRVVFIFGTRPEAIKLVPLIEALRKHEKLAEPVLICTGQQREMSKQVLDAFSLVPDVNLDIMTANQSLEEIVTRSLSLLSQALCKVKADVVIVQGDTSTAFVGALSAFYNQIPVAHVEAGLRTTDIYQPFPEEVNRRLICPLASLHYAPTERSRDNLLREGVPADRVLVTGNTGIDTLRLTADRVLSLTTLKSLESYDDTDAATTTILVTAHRRENFGQPMQNICDALLRLCDLRPNLRVVFSVSHNPHVKQVVTSRLSDCPQITLLAPPDYPSFVRLLNDASLVLTDSGGIQEEAPTLGKPVLVLRDKTERPEGLSSGNARLVGTNPDTIVASVLELLTNRQTYVEMATARNPYGDGHASDRIINHLLSHFGLLSEIADECVSYEQQTSSPTVISEVVIPLPDYLISQISPISQIPPIPSPSLIPASLSPLPDNPLSELKEEEDFPLRNVG